MPGLHAVLILVRVNQLLVVELVGCEHIGRDEEGGFALHGVGERLVVDDEARLDLPLSTLRGRVLARPTGPILLELRLKRRLRVRLAAWRSDKRQRSDATR